MAAGEEAVASACHPQETFFHPSRSYSLGNSNVLIAVKTN